MGKNAVIVDAIRTPIGKKKGALSSYRPDELGAMVLRELVRRVGVSPNLVDDVIMGCVTQINEQGFNIGRQAALLADFPIEVPAVTINRVCGSSQHAVHFAAQAVMSGMQDIVIAAGVESMSRVPIGSDMGQFSPALLERFEITHQGMAAEKIAKKYELTRSELDRFSYESHEKARNARNLGWFSREILPIRREDGTIIEHDEGIREAEAMSGLSSLRPSFLEDGVLTAGNSSQISDGTAAMLITSEKKAQELGLKPRARIVAMDVIGSDPELMLTGPITATQRVLRRNGFKLSDIDVFEVNEAFSSVVLAWQKELNPPAKRVNPNGGAIALGHPLGASGVRIMTTMLHELERTGGRFGLQTMCIGMGMATATIIERLE
jgi:acetyl-CoA acyltransferase